MPRKATEKFKAYYVIYFDLEEQREKRIRCMTYQRAVDLYILYSEDKRNYGYCMLLALIDED